MTTTKSPKPDSNGDATKAILDLALERALAELDALGKHDPEQAQALAQAWIERIRETLE